MANKNKHKRNKNLEVKEFLTLRPTRTQDPSRELEEEPNRKE